MLCDRCGAERRPTGPCPRCGAPPAAMGGVGGARPYGGRGQGRGSGAGWGAYGEPSGGQAGRSSGRNPRGGGGYEQIDPGRALVPSPQDMSPVNVGAAMPAIPGLPQTEEEERALGIRRPVYIPANGSANGDQQKRRISSFRVISGVLSLMLVCIAACSGLAFVEGKNITNLVSIHPQFVRQTPLANSFTQVPGTPVATPGAAAKYVTSATTAHNVDTNNAPVDISSKFTVNHYVYVAYTVRNIAQGTKHIISVHWYLNNIDVGLGPTAYTTYTLTGDVSSYNGYFALQYPQQGLGMVRLYWDRPASDTSNSATDQYLAQTLYFVIQAPVPTPTPTAQPTATPGTPAAHG